MPKPVFDQTEFAATLHRLGRGEDAGAAPQNPDYDGKLAADYAEAVIQGRSIDDFKRVLGHWGFRFKPPHLLTRYPDGRAHGEGEWRSNALELAFTDNDVLSKFRGPEDFHQWISRLVMKKRAARAGIILP